MPKLVHQHLDFCLGEQPAPREVEFKSPSKQYGIRSQEFMSQHVTMQHPALGIGVHYSDENHIHAECLLMDFIFIDGFYPLNAFNRSVQHLYFCLKMGPEDTKADDATGPGSQQALKRDVPYATATPSPPQQLPNAGGSGAPGAQRPVLYHRSCSQLQTRL